MLDVTPSRSQIEDAAEACKKQILKQKDTMTMKIARGMLETRMELPAGSLKAVKDTVAQVIDQLLVRSREPVDAASPGQASQRDGHSHVDEQQSADEDAEQDENRPPKRQRNKDSELRRKTKKKPAAAPAGKAPGNRKLETLKAICAKAGVRPPPSVYKQADDAARVRALEHFMEGKGLSRHSTPAEIMAVKRSLEREKDLEGIDMSNIVSGGRRGRQQAVAQPVDYRAMVGSDSEAESESDSEADEQDPASQPADSGEPSEASARDGSDAAAASEHSDDGSDGDSAASLPAASASPAAQGAKDEHSPGFKENTGAAAGSGDDHEDGEDAAEEAEDAPPSQAPPAAKRRAVISDSDDE